MSTYFKYTNGEAFKLNGREYTGFFHINDNGEILTEKYNTQYSELLSKKNTFISDLFSNKLELNTAYKNIDQLVDYYSNVFDLLNKEGTDELTSVINNNNLLTFKSLIIDNPIIYNFDPNKNHFYGFPSLSASDTLEAYSEVISISPFSSNQTWEFLDDVVCGTFIVKYDNAFNYFCSGGTKTYVLSGSFTEKTPLAIISEVDFYSDDPELLDYTYNINYSDEDTRILFVNKETINIYDASNFSDCNKLFLVDKIKLPFKTTTDIYIWNKTRYKFSEHKKTWGTRFFIYNDNNPQYIKFGKNLRSAIYNNILYLYNKYSSDLLYEIDLSLYDVEDVIDLDIRNIDDHVILVNEKETGIYVLYIDINDIESSKNEKLEDILPDLDWYSIKFSNIDSDIFMISNEYQYQTRHISYKTYPTGRLNAKNLQYLSRYKWNKAREVYRYANFLWNSSKLVSNSYHNILSNEQAKNNKRYLLLHNIGRIYAIYSDMPERYSMNTEFEIPKYFNGFSCSESSIGIHLNSAITNIVKDCLNLYNKSFGKFKLTETGVEDVSFSDLEFESSNFYINGNETFNVLVLRRILTLLKETQEKIKSIT